MDGERNDEGRGMMIKAQNRIVVASLACNVRYWSWCLVLFNY